MNPADEQSDRHSHVCAGWQGYRLTTLRILSLAFAAGALVFLGATAAQLPCWGFFFLLGLVSWPVWRYRTEYVLLRRRVMLSALARPESRFRAWLWRGTISKAVQLVIAMLLSWLLLVLVSRMSVQHWILLGVDAVFLALIVAPVSRHLSGQLSVRHLDLVARHWPLFLINGVVLTAAVMALDFFLVGALDSRHLEWQEVAVQAFVQVMDEAVCTLWGVSAGLLASFEDLAWHSSQLIIPRLPDPTARLIAWSFFLLRAATLAYVFTALLLGVGLFLDGRQGGQTGGGSAGTVSRTFFLTIIILALPFFYATIKLNQLDPAVLERGVAGAAGWVNPCKLNETRRERLIAQLDGEVDSVRRQAVQAVDSRIDAGLEDMFAEVEKGIDSYLDWYFSVLGEYQRLVAVLGDDLVAVMGDELEQHLFEPGEFDVQLRHLEGKLQRLSAERMAGLVPQLADQLNVSSCDIGAIRLTPLTQLDRDALRASAAMSSGVGAGIVSSSVLAKKTAAALAGKLAAKKSFQAGAALGSKTLAKKGSSSLLSAGVGTALCAPSGPVAIVCGVSAGLVTWLSVDKALIELEEGLHREEMRSALLEVLATQRAELGEQLKLKHHARLDAMAARVNDAVQSTFIPYRDGTVLP